MSPAHSPERPTLLGGLALVAISLIWAAWAWRDVRAREEGQIERMTGAVVSALETALDPGPRGLEPADLEAHLRARMQLRRPLEFIALDSRDRALVRIGRVPEGVDPRTAPEGPSGRDLRIFRRTLWSADAADQPTLNPWRWKRPTDLPTSPITATLGFRTTLSRRVYETAVVQIGGTLLVSWLAIGALVVAWRRNVRARSLARDLELERRERARLEELNLAAAGLAHETKNPLGIILGLAQRIVRDPAASPEMRLAGGRIVDAADRAAARISEFLTFARVATPVLTAVRADEVARRVADALRGDFEDAGVALELTLTPLEIRCEAAMLEQVLVNLLLNALQASAPGTCTRLGIERRGAGAVLTVRDEGSGIPPALLPRLGKPYVTGRPDGHGLGLAIVHRIADAHGWRLDIETSTAPQGALPSGTCVTLSDMTVAKPP